MPTVREMPSTRPLKIFALDPQFVTFPGNKTSINVDFEPLAPGPEGDRVVVVDYDGGNDVTYAPCNLEDRAVLMEGGIEHSEADPGFHQQMVYAVAMRTIRAFDKALGRRLKLYRDKTKPKLRLIPHAFVGANAFYDWTMHAVLFGYFRADPNQPGDNLPNQIVFTCLSHDIITHEVTHALIQRLRPHFLEPTNPDMLAFHEGFADLVAIFQHFTYPVTLRALIREAKGDVGATSILSQIAVQFGQSTRRGAALRSAMRDPKARLSASIKEPHARGGILLAAVFDAFDSAYTEAIGPLIRLATGGSGVLAPGELHPELVDQLTNVAAEIADETLTMIIRAFDYMPPMDMTFGDFLRATITSHAAVAPDDRWGLRAALIAACRARAIYPEGVLSLSEESVVWPHASDALAPIDLDDALEWFHFDAVYSSLDPDRRGDERTAGGDGRVHRRNDKYRDLQVRAAKAIHAWADTPQARAELGLHPTLTVAVRSFHRVARVSQDGRILNEIVFRLEQQIASSAKDTRFGGLTLRGGCTVIASANGAIRYVIGKPLPRSGRLGGVAKGTFQPGGHPPPGDETGQHDPGTARANAIAAFVEDCDLADPQSTYRDPRGVADRMVARASLRALHGGDC